jgi:predicted GIY-YIG superfamily endonuclease
MADVISIQAARPDTWITEGRTAPWHVYVMYEEHWRIETPLYVGVTSQLYDRLSHHRRDRDWWPLVGEIAIVRFGAKADAYEAEEMLIRDLRPLFNVAGNLHTPALEIAEVVL